MKKSLKNPPNKFWANSKQPIAVAHRGGDAAGEDKENTLVAFEAARHLGYQYGETDVVLSADGHVVAIHGSRNRVDKYFKKGRPPRRVVQKMPYEDIQKKISVGGEKVPLLEDLLKSQPDMRFFLDPKTDEVVEPLAELLKRLKVLDRVCINSFSYERIERLLELLRPNKVTAGLIIGRGVRLVNKNLDRLKDGRLPGIEAIHLHHSHVSKNMMDLAHSRGIRIFVWTANTPLSIRNAINTGADGIISDDINLLKKLLETIK